MTPPQQRIYVGGIDPDLLSVQMVLDRLKNHLHNESTSSTASSWACENVNVGSCYFQVDAVLSSSSTNPEEEEGSSSTPSAMELAKKLLNNVTWKGCKLRVEEARPHLLERLEQERLDKQRSSTQSQSKPLPNKEEEQSQPQKQQTRRHYKIRRAFGETVWHVDTKPFEVEDYRNFDKLKQKLAKRATPSEPPPSHQNAKKNAPTPLPIKRKSHRAIHIRFAAPDHGRSSQVPQSLETDDSDSSNNSASESSVESSSARSKSEENQVKPTKGGYEWSSSSEEEEGDEEEEETNKTALVPTNVKDAYKWSSDEEEAESGVENDGSDDEDEPQKDLSEKWNPMDEFDMGVVGNDLSEDQPAKPVDPSTLEDVDFEKEEKSNQNILSQLFPDLPIPKDPSKRQEEAPKVGWGTSGTMLRFDPTKQSSQQFVLEEAEKQGQETDDNEENANAELRESVYHQSELENVFREARETNDAPVVLESKEAAQETQGGFSFSFQVGQGGPATDTMTTSQAPQTDQAFSFGFDLPAPPANTTTTTVESQPSIPNENTEANEQSTPKSQRKRRFGFSFPREDLDKYVRGFFDFRDGKRILQDPEAFQKDPEVQKDWESERVALTADWKRKKRQAMSRRTNHHNKGGFR